MFVNFSPQRVTTNFSLLVNLMSFKSCSVNKVGTNLILPLRLTARVEPNLNLFKILICTNAANLSLHPNSVINKIPLNTIIYEIFSLHPNSDKQNFTKHYNI